MVLASSGVGDRTAQKTRNYRTNGAVMEDGGRIDEKGNPRDQEVGEDGSNATRNKAFILGHTDPECHR